MTMYVSPYQHKYVEKVKQHTVSYKQLKKVNITFK